MKKFMKRMIAGLMTMAMVIALFVNCGNVYEVNAATKYSLEEKSYKGKQYPGVDKGYYYIPTNVKGTLPAVVFIHGMGGLKKDIYKRQVERFINSGYISPFVLIMPNLEGVGHDAYVCKDKANGEEWLGRVIDRMDNGEFDTKDVKIDKTSGYSIAGYSMGGSSAVLAGIAYNKKFINVGGLSPSVQLHYPAWGVSWIMESSETKSCKFTNNSQRHLLFSSGSSKNENTGEKEDTHLACVKRCLNLFGDNNGFAQVVYDYEEHNAYLFAQEFFNFLYYIQHDELPSDEIIRKVFEDDIDYLEGIPNPGPISRKRIIMPSDQKSSNGKPVINSITPSVSDNTVKMGQNYSISVNATGSNLSYQWMWRTDKSDWKASGCSGSKEATIQLEGKRPVVYYKCIVSNSSGSVESAEIPIYLAKPVLKSSLSNNTVKKGQNYTISVDVKNSKVTYKWEYNKNDGYGWKVSQVAGCTTDTLSLVGKNPEITYKCTITYKDGSNTFSVTSDEIKITMVE